ncbi:MAG: hypothetical protein GY768_16275 [Planctomycetaceae bacterium]|nr:hypothetical protein [Planctomycetaceae bacterium]
MNRRHHHSRLESLEARCLLAADPIISEFMASNRGSLVDTFGETSDWIEIYNAGDAAANLDGWFLTDDLEQRDKWQFPVTRLNADEHLLVHASGRDITIPGVALHTNFRLSAAGESLALVKSDGNTIVSQVTFPKQLPDVSYGVIPDIVSIDLAGPNSPQQTLVPQDDQLGTRWTRHDATIDESWTVALPPEPGAPWAVGFDRGARQPDEGAYATTVLADRPTGYWQLEESSGRVAENVGSTGLFQAGFHQPQIEQVADGVLIGQLDHALRFESTEERKVDVPFDHQLNNESFTAEAWVQIDEGSGYRSVLTSRDVSPQAGYMLYAGSSNHWEFWTGDGKGSWNILRGPQIETAKWTHLVGTYDQETNQQVLYVNGVEADRLNVEFAPNRENPLRIGAGATEGEADFFFTGTIDEVAVYDRALSPSLIRAHFDQGKPLPTQLSERNLLLAEFSNSGPSALGEDATRLAVVGKTSEFVTYANPDGRLLIDGGGSGSAVFLSPLSEFNFEHPVVVRTEARWEIGEAPGADANANFGLVALHRQGTGAKGGDRKGGLFALAQPLQNGTVELKLGFQTNSTGTFRDSFVVTSSDQFATAMDPGQPLQLELILGGVEEADRIRFRVVQQEQSVEMSTSVGDFRRSLINGSSVQLAFDQTLAEIRQDPSSMNVGLMRTRPTGNASQNVAAYDSFSVAQQIPVDESTVANYSSQIQIDLAESMHGKNATAYVRLPFQTDPDISFQQLSLSAKYDDGFVAYLNGQEIARRNAPDLLNWNSAATARHPDALALVSETIDLTSHRTKLQPGENVLAVHGLNADANDVDFLLAMKLQGKQSNLDRHEFAYLGGPSPGAANSIDGVTLGPVIDQVQHQPLTPTPTQPITVTAKLATAPDESDLLTLSYRVMYESEQQLPMRDDGVLPDTLAGDGIYTATIPSSVANPGEMIRYFVSAQDKTGNRFRSPYLPNPAETDGQDRYYGTVVRGEAIETPLPVFEWFVPEPRWHVSGGGNNTKWSEASVYYGGRFYDNVQVRARGLTTISWTKPKFKFEFNEGNYFHHSEELEPVEEFNLQSHYRETGAVSYMGETLAFEWLREIGVAAPLAFPMHTRQNGDFYSLASFVEQVDETFLRRNGFDPEGSMYKANSGAVMSTLRPNPSRAHYLKATRKDESFDDLTALTNGINNRIDGVDRSTYIFDHINLPQVINDMAGNVIMPNHDRLTKNYYMYRDVNGSNQWSRFPWDMDQAFSRFTVDHFSSVLYGDSEHPQSPNPVHQNHLYDAILDTPATREMYLRRVRTLVDQYLNTGYFQRGVDKYSDLLTVDADRDHLKWRAGNIRSGVNRIKSNVAFRQKQLEAEGLLPGNEPITADLVLLDENVTVAAMVPQDDSLGQNWTGGNEPFDESTWIVGPSGVGFDNGRNPIYAPDIGVRLEPREVCSRCTSIFARYRFQVEDPTAVNNLILQMKFDDGFLAYLNGTPVWQENVEANPGWDDRASSPATETTDYHDFDISAFQHRLKPGENILAIHALNASTFSNDMLLRPRLLAGEQRVSEVKLSFGQVEFNPASGNQDEEYIELVNEGNSSVDLSEWQISGGVEFRFQPGTVIPANSTLYISPNLHAFHHRTEGPRSGQRRFVLGNYQGHLSNFGEQIQLISNTGAVVATHSTPQAPSNVQRFLRVSELHYHPSQLSDAEFIELTNISQADQAILLDLSGVQISEGPSEPFVFAPETQLEPGESWLVVKDTNAFITAFPTADINRIAGNFVGRLNNQGERIKVDDATGSTVLQFTYQDQAPWPNQADGQGASLQLVNLTNDPTDPSNWLAIQPTPGMTQSTTADLNQDGQVNEADITRMCHLITTADQAADFNGNGSVGMEDVRFFIETAMGTDVGDANLDGRFDSADFVLVFQAGEYEDQTVGNSTWSEGDWNCDGDFATDDLVFAFQAGGFSLAAQPQLPIPAEIAPARFWSEQNARDQLHDGQHQPSATTADTQSPSDLQVREMVFSDWGLQVLENRKRTLIANANHSLPTSTTSAHDLLLQEVDDHHFDRLAD